jgi:2-C-methyl-D-erythritol 2,4-cyclodiphosphate synthase
MGFRVGFGYDVHQLKQGEDFILGGVSIPHDKGPFGHSDADLLVHVIIDAMLGAANLGDIGRHFPDTDPQFKDISSLDMLSRVKTIVAEKGYSFGNADCTVCLQEPKIGPHIAAMQEHIASVLEVDPDRISVKATTSERMGFVGRTEGVTAYAVVLLEI